MHGESNLNSAAASTGPAVAGQPCRRCRRWRSATQSGPPSGSAWLALLLLLFCTLSGAEPDDTQQAWLDRVDLPAHWDNIEGAPDWIEGARPGFRPGRRLHSVMLSTGQSVTVRVAAGERLRLQRPDGALGPEGLAFDWSNGSGLFASLAPELYSDGSSLLVTPPGVGESLLRVRNEGHAVDPLELALFVSRDANRLTATSYRKQMSPRSPATRVRLAGGPDRGDYWQAGPGRPLVFELHDETRIRLDSRLLLPVQGGPYADSYRITAYLDGVAWRVLDLATLLDTSGAISVDRCNRAVGRQGQAYLEIPDGAQRLELRIRRPMLIRLLARQQTSDYLYQGNLPLDYQTTVASAGSQDSTPYFWGRGEAALSDIRDRLSRPDSVTYLDAVRVAHNNAHQLGGLVSMEPLAAWARRYPGQGQYHSLAARRQLLHTFYRDLLPSGPVSDTLFAWFPTPQLARRSDPLFFSHAYAASAAGNLAGGFFSTLTTAPDRALEFLLPEQAPLTLLRVTVDRAGLSAPETLFLQLDRAPPIRLQVAQERVVHPSGFRPNSGLVGLSLLQQGQDVTSATLSGPFGSRHTAAPLVDASFIELPIPATVRRLRLWRETEGGETLRVALAYRTSGWYRMSEAGYLGLLDTLGASEVQRQWRQALPAYAGTGGQPAVRSAQQDMLADLNNQWLPLLRFLHARYHQFSSRVKQSGDRDDRPAEADRAGVAAAVRQAQLAARSGEWQSALEQWSSIRRTSDGARQAQARSGQIEALTQLGDLFLARQLLRHDLLYANQAASRRQALERLLGIAEREGDLEGVVTLRAVWAILDPQPAALNDLAAALTATGRDHFALLVLLTLPRQQRHPQLVLAAAYAEGWWRLFDETLSATPEPRLQSLWQGYRAQLRGDYEGALESWRKAGPAGVSLANHLAEGLQIRATLDSPEPQQRRRALLQWEVWQQHTPDAAVWREIPHSVTSHGGVKSVISKAQWEFSKLFRATPATPVTLAVYGPASLRFEVRPLHAAGDGEPINDWITVRSRNGERRYPIVDNRVSPGLQLVRETRPLPGQGVEILYQVPAGYHRLQLDGGQHDVLLKIMALRPRSPLTVLPPLNPFTARAALDRSTPVSAPGNAAAVRLLQHCSGELPLAVHPFGGGGRGGGPEIPVPTAAWFEQLEASRGQQRQPPVQDAAATRGPSLSGRLSELLWQAEQAPGRYLESLTEAEQLAQGHPPERAGESILRRLRRKASWELITTVQQSAGVRLVEFSGWQPESPAMKTRKAVMEPAADDEQIVSGHDSRVLSMYNTSPVELTLDLSMQDIAHLPAQSMRVMLGWDDQPETALLLSPSQPHATRVKKIAAGNHRVRIRIEQPLANQFLRVKVSERRGGTSRLVSEPFQRNYTLATREQPLVLLLQGPTRLRIDEWRDGRTVTSYRSLAAGWQTVAIEVEKGRDEALLRVFRRTLEPEKPSIPVRATGITERPVAAPLWHTDQAPQTPPPATPDPLAMGGQEDGTWSLLSGAVSRRTLDDEPHGGSEAERFFWLGSAYHYFSADQQTYYQAGGQLRLREQGDPVLAIDGSISVRKPDWPLDLDIGGSLLLQNLDYSGRTEYAATLRTRLSRSLRLSPVSSHRPSLALFQRWLSLDQLPAEERAAVDQEIYTRYKRDHTRGLRIGDRIDYRPWLDNVLYAGAYLVSNQDLNILDPDHLSLNIGARQLMGDLSLGLDYRWSRYFEDSDREQDDDAQRLRLDLGFSRWLTARHGLQANLRYEYDHDSAASSLFLSFSLDLSNGRYYRDFRPNDLDFRWLRQRRAMERQATTSGLE